MALILPMNRGLNLCKNYPWILSRWSAFHPPALCGSSYRRPGFPQEHTPLWNENTFNFREKVKFYKKHLGLLMKEAGEHLRGPEGRDLKEYILEQTNVVWEFRGPEDLQKWLVTSDLEIGGKSQAFLKLGSNNQTAYFHGELNMHVPADGVTQYSGYCAMRSRKLKKSFNRKLLYDWSKFNTLHLRVRGDGRPWVVFIQPEMYFEQNTDDLYSYSLYTRGGPYWEDIKIPFSKFILTNQGRVQDEQQPLWSDKVSFLGFTLADRAEGAFYLEIDFIGLCKDHAHTEEFAYEIYKSPVM